MSLIKWRKREITTAICSLILVIVNVILFHLVWSHCYLPFYYSKFYSIGLYAAEALCFGLYILLGRFYGAFWLKVSRISELIYANMVTNIITAGIMYGVAWIFIRHLPNILPLLFVILIWTIVACLWVRPAIMLVNHYCAVERMVIVYGNNGGSHNGRKTLNRVMWRFQVVGEIAADKEVQAIMEELKILHAEAVLLCDMSPELKNEILKYCILDNIVTYVQPNAGDYLINSAKSVQIANLPFLCCQRASNSNLYTFVKRFYDISLSLFGILISGPLMLGIYGVIKLYDKGPALVIEKRVTLNKREFDLYKFRATRCEVDENDKAYKSIYADERLTPIGKVLRRFRMDELPKLFNVLKGDLAIVGPRADEASEAEACIREMPEYALKFQAKAGLTGYVQIYGRYTTNRTDRLQMDLMYMGQENLAWDLKMILATIKVIFLPEGMDLVLDGKVYTEEGEIYNGEAEA